MCRPNIGGIGLFFVSEIGLNIPDEAYDHPVIKEMQEHVLDLVTLDIVSINRLLTQVTPVIRFFIQDMISYNIEQTVGEVRRNIITVLMREFDLDVQGAMDRAHEYHREI